MLENGYFRSTSNLKVLFEVILDIYHREVDPKTI